MWDEETGRFDHSACTPRDHDNEMTDDLRSELQAETANGTMACNQLRGSDLLLRHQRLVPPRRPQDPGMFPDRRTIRRVEGDDMSKADMTKTSATGKSGAKYEITSRTPKGAERVAKAFTSSGAKDVRTGK